MARPTKLTPTVLDRVESLRTNYNLPYKDIVAKLAQDNIHTTIGSLKVKLSQHRKPVETSTPSLVIDRDELRTLIQQELRSLFTSLFAPAPQGPQSVKQTLLTVMNGDWYSYRDLSRMVYGDDSRGDTMRKYINRFMKDLVETKREGRIAKVRKVRPSE